MNCDRCGNETKSHTTSWFNTEDICPTCQTAEEAHPELKAAKRKEAEEVLKGNHNYEGVGLPKELQHGN